MTRINCIPVSELTDQHLLAEYRELPRLANLARLPRKNEVFPESYRMGAGHVKFFYNKGAYLKDRFENGLVKEMVRRGFKPTFTYYKPHPDGLNEDWQPTIDDEMINASRINDRLDGVKG